MGELGRSRERRRNCGIRARASVAASAVLLALTSFGCAEAHHIQVSDVDSSQGRLEPFQIHVSATGISAEEGIEIAKAVSSDAETKRNLDSLETIIALTQMGPKTGDPTLSDDWADAAAAKVLEQCPSGRVTGIVTRRETMDYPVVTGEIVTVRGYCIL
jgi:hypothetical protein